MSKWWQSKRVAWGESLVLLAVGGLATYLKPVIGIPILLIFLGVGIWLIISANKRQAILVGAGGETVEVSKKKPHFTQVDAWNMYEQFNESLRKLRELVKIRQKEQKDSDEIFKDERFSKIMNDVLKAREKCTDKTLNKYLIALWNDEVHCARFNFNLTEVPHGMNIEYCHQIIRDHISRMKE